MLERDKVGFFFRADETARTDGSQNMIHLECDAMRSNIIVLIFNQTSATERIVLGLGVAPC